MAAFDGKQYITPSLRFPRDMLKTLLGLILVLWYDLTTLPLKTFARKYGLLRLPLEGIKGKTTGHRTFPTGPNVPAGTTYRMRTDRARSWYWEWYAIDRWGALNKVSEEVAIAIRHKHFWWIARNRVFIALLLVVPPVLAYLAVSLIAR